MGRAEEGKEGQIRKTEGRVGRGRADKGEGGLIREREG